MNLKISQNEFQETKFLHMRLLNLTLKLAVLPSGFSTVLWCTLMQAPTQSEHGGPATSSPFGTNLGNMVQWFTGLRWFEMV